MCPDNFYVIIDKNSGVRDNPFWKDCMGFVAAIAFYSEDSKFFNAFGRLDGTEVISVFREATAMAASTGESIERQIIYDLIIVIA